MRSRILDLETIGHPDAAQWLDPVEPDPRCTKPESIAKSIAERTAERDERLGLDPDCCRIVALGYQDIGKESTVYLCSNEFEEREQLKQFWGSYVEQETRLITYNGFRFDLPVVVMRSLYLNVPHPVLNFSPAWKAWPHVDLWERLSLNGARRDVKGLRFYAKRFGLPVYDDITGADVAKMIAAGEWRRVENHCLFDLDLTRALAERLGVLTPQGVAA